MTRSDSAVLWEPSADYQAPAGEHDAMRQAGGGHARDLRDPWFDQAEARHVVQG